MDRVTRLAVALAVVLQAGVWHASASGDEPAAAAEVRGESRPFVRPPFPAAAFGFRFDMNVSEVRGVCAANGGWYRKRGRVGKCLNADHLESLLCYEPDSGRALFTDYWIELVHRGQHLEEISLFTTYDNRGAAMRCWEFMRMSVERVYGGWPHPELPHEEPPNGWAFGDNLIRVYGPTRNLDEPDSWSFGVRYSRDPDVDAEREELLLPGAD